ncbi:MAG: 6-phosphofructokinase [Oscillospiraceae bacterium]|nr:6-phosphofructokinase [Oscillospiraceae bacterium]
MKRIGILTSGGDAPGMNAAVVSVARSAALYGVSLVGIKRGYNGLLRRSAQLADDAVELDLDTVLDIADQPGTYLRTARCEEFLDPAWRAKAAQHVRDMGIEGLVIIGGDGSYQGAMRLCELGVPCVGIPGTIDNDLAYTEMTLGYDTAVNVCVDAIRAIRATSRSHDRPAVVEVMGRNCGDIALKAAVSTGAEIVIVPEVPWHIDDVADRLNRLIARGNNRVTVVVAEGAYASMAPFDVYGFLTARGKQCYPGEGISALRLASILKRKCGMVEARSTVLGYVQRGQQPAAYDSAFAFEAGNLAVRLLLAGDSNRVVGIRDGRIFHMDITQALAERRAFHRELYDLVNEL